MAGTWGGPDSQRLNLRQQQRKLGVLEAGNLAINTRNSDRSVALLWKAVAAAADHMSKDDALNLAPGNPRTLAFGDNVRKDLTLLELDECVLQELLDKGCVPFDRNSLRDLDYRWTRRNLMCFSSKSITFYSQLFNLFEFLVVSWELATYGGVLLQVDHQGRGRRGRRAVL